MPIPEALDRIIGHSGRTHDAAAVGQMSLFGDQQGNGMDIAIELLRPDSEFSDSDQREELAWEKDLIGVYVSEHPLSRYTDLYTTHVSATSADFDQSLNGKGATVLGLLTSLRNYVTKKGSAMAFGAMEDLHGSFELIFFPRTWAKVRSEIQVDRVYLVRGEVRIEADGNAKLLVESITDNLSVALPIEPVVEPAGSKTEAKVDSIGTNGNAARPVRPTGNGNLTKARPEIGAPPAPPNFEDDELESLPPPGLSSEDSLSSDGDTGTTKDIHFSSRKTIVVEIKAVRNWESVCQQVVWIMDDYEGQDTLKIRITGKAMQMEFPNLHTLVCPESISTLKQLPAVKDIQID